MKKRCIVFAAAIIILVPLMSFAAFASVNDGGTAWDVIDAVWGFVGDIISSMSRGFNSVVSTLSEMIRAIRGFFSDLIKAVGNAVTAILDGIKRLFVPRDNYFSEIQKKLRTAFNKKTGSFLSLANYLQDRFSKLSAYSSPSSMFTVEFSKNSIYNGYRLDLFKYGRNYIPYIRPALTGIITLAAIAFCYRRILSMINA